MNLSPVEHRIRRASLAEIRRYAMAPPPPAGFGARLQGIAVRPAPPPPPLANMTLWLRANVPASITVVAGHVTNWADQSGNGHDMNAVGGAATQPTVGASINGHVSIDAASGQTMNSATTGWTLANIITGAAWTCYVVWKYTGGRVYTFGGFAADAANPMMIEDLPGQDWGTPVGDSGGGLARVGSYNFAGGANETHVDGGSIAGAYQSLHKQSAGVLSASIGNGGVPSTTATGVIGTLTSHVSIFATGVLPYIGSLAEVIVYNVANSGAVDTQVQNWLTFNWGV